MHDETFLSIDRPMQPRPGRTARLLAFAEAHVIMIAAAAMVVISAVQLMIAPS